MSKKPKVLLINSNRFKHPWPVIPFGLCCVASAIEKADYPIEVIDLNFAKNVNQSLEQAITSFKPDIIGISIRNIDDCGATTGQFFIDKVKSDFIDPIKGLFDGPILLGGPAVGVSGEEILEHLDLQYAVRGDGEIASVEFVRRHAANESQVGLPGLIIRDEGKIIQTATASVVPDLDVLAPVNPQKYIDLAPYRKFNSPIQIQTKRGCALKCSYCTYNLIEGYSYRYHSPENVAQSIAQLAKETGIYHFEITDSAFNIPLPHAKKVLKEIIKLDLPLQLRTLGLNPGGVDEELVDLMNQAGFSDLDVGVESFSNDILKTLQKNYRQKHAVKTAGLLKRGGIQGNWFLMLGAPNETEESLKECFEVAAKTVSPWDLVVICAGIRVYKGSPLALQMKHADEETTNFLYPTFVEPEKISFQRIRYLTKLASFKYPNFYINDEDDDTPEFVLRMVTGFFKVFSPRTPVWKAHIFLRKMQYLTGISTIKKWIFLWRGQPDISKVNFVKYSDAESLDTVQEKRGLG